MEWFTAENVIAVFTAGVGVAVSIGVLRYERRVPRRTRIGYRVQMDTPIGSDVSQGRANVRLGLFDETPDMSDATLVLLRIENDGSQSIAGDDYTGRELHGLTVEFTDRMVRGIAVTQPVGAEHLMEHFTPAAGMRHGGQLIRLPRVPLNRNEHFKLLVLLTGGPVGSPIRVVGGIRDGEIRPNTAARPDDKPPLFSRAARFITVALTAGMVTLATMILVVDRTPPPVECARGKLTVVGSTAFEPAVSDLAKLYMEQCEGATVAVDMHGSDAGVRLLGDATASTPGPVVAFSDGPRPNGYPRLRENGQIALVLFSLVVNDGVPVRNLSLENIRKIYRGEIRDWKDLGSPTSIPIRLVSRDADSGTRTALQSRVLGGNEPIPTSSRDCETNDDPAVPVVRCELGSTEEVLRKVARVDGAIGYSELRDGRTPAGLARLSIDGVTPSPDTITGTGYPYWVTEHAYTYDAPPAGSLAARFIAYVTSHDQQALRAHGHVPCSEARAAAMCASGA
ncbi:PstS family phosphate ABC transporter substrate-binding protein [uncultured Streptomyces sp.]|uniref:PstS family phosphate ABC transporter substrate-binding protein n=1 Tax=uncultured Streptomyces sp. TaxID=174707 RepID=UPI00260951C7|nr:substrate-binding domain-containing protein [uncultured Streptomyces sp.]